MLSLTFIKKEKKMITGSTVFSYFLVYLLIGFVFLGILYVYGDKFGMDELFHQDLERNFFLFCILWICIFFGVSYYLINNFLLFILKKIACIKI